MSGEMQHWWQRCLQVSCLTSRSRRTTERWQVVAGSSAAQQCTHRPSSRCSWARQNLHLFRFKNTRFDIIGGAFYFLMVVSHISCSLLLRAGVISA